MLKFILLILFFFNLSICYSQYNEIKINVKDNKNASIFNSTVQIKNKDFESMKFGFTNIKGEVEFKVQTEIFEFIVQTSYLGYKTDTTLINLNTTRDQIFIVNIVLKEDFRQLKEVYVKPKLSITQDNDTTTYKVSDFTTSDNRSLEDVIKKMPGMQVQEDGTIAFKGKKISKILLDGDDVTGDKYKLITRNISPQQVTDIQAIENYIEDALLKGIINSDEVVLNLKVKNPKAIIGNLDFAYGTNDRNEISANFISYIKNNKSFIYANTNNLGRLKSQDFSVDLENQKILPANPLINRDIFSFSPFAANNLALNQSQAASINFVNTASKNLKLKGKVNYFTEALNASSIFETEYFEPNAILTQDINRENNNRTNLDSEIDLDYLINPHSRILGTFKFTNQPYEYNSSGLSVFDNLNIDSVFQQLNNANNTFFSNLKYTHKLSNNSALIVSNNYFSQNLDQAYLPKSSIYVSHPNFNGSNQLNQTIKQNYDVYKFNVNSLKRKGSNFFDFNLGYNNINTNLSSSLAYFDNQSFESLGNNYINSQIYINNSFYLNSKYILEKEFFKLKLELKNSYQQFNVSENDTSLLIIEPSLTFNWKLSQIKNISLSYNYKNTPIEPFNFYNNDILNSFRSLSSALNQFYNFGNHNYTINYGYNDFSDKYFSFNIQSNYTYSNKGFIYENFFENNFYITRQIIFDGFKSYGVNINAKKFVPKVSTSFSVNYSWNNRDYFNKVGNQINEYSGVNQGLTLKGDTGFDFPVNFNLLFQYIKSITNQNRQAIAFNNSYKYNLISRFKFSDVIVPFINFEWARVNKQNYRMLNSEVQINPKKGKLKYSLEGKNLLNLKSYDNFFIDNAQSSRFSNQILGRYVAARIQLSIQ